MTASLYKSGLRHRKIKELGESNQLTFQAFLDLFGEQKSHQEIDRLLDLGLIALDESTLDEDGLIPTTKILWLMEAEGE